MALQIWLPLDGDFNNQGILKDLNFTTSGTIQDIDGKIGKAKHFATGMAKAPLAYTLGNEFSFACWVYYDSFRSDNEWIFEIANSTSGYEKAVFGIASGESKKKIVLCLGGTVNRTTVHGFVVNTWYHIAFTWDGTTAKVYKNGELLNNFTMAKGSITSGTNISIGSNVANSNTKLSGRLNDIRVYNHCLSVREVKELAKGLVLHYKLNKPLHTNLLTIKPKSHDATAYNAYQLNLLENLQSGQTYTLQLWDVDVSHSAKTVTQTGVWVYWGGGSISLFNWAGSSHFTNGHANYLIKTFTVTAANASGSGATNAWLNIYNSVGNASGTRNLTIGAWKLEKGSVATPFDIGVNDPAYAVAGYSAGIEPDCSGYKRDGKNIDVPIGSIDTARYRTSTYFDGNNDGILIENLDLNPIINNSYTISFWIKSEGENGGRSVWFGAYSGTSPSLEKNSSNNLRLYWDGNPDMSLSLGVTDGEWHHIALVCDGLESTSSYLDGILKQTSTIARTVKNFATTWRIGRDTRSGDGTPYHGLMSDFRIYCTALSADDIKALYEDAGYIDKNGNFHAYEYVEI